MTKADGAQQQLVREEEGRSARKRRAILEAATASFYESGYLGTSMDTIAARATVSKRTVYQHFADKQQLFHEIVLQTVDDVDQMFTGLAARLAQTDDVDRELADVARQFAEWLMQPETLRLRRLIIAEASRFPELGTTWYRRGFETVINMLADALHSLAQRGLLEIGDARAAASQLMGLTLWIPVNQVMFCGEQARPSKRRIDEYVRNGVRTFLAAYRPPR